jgi:twitching motility protein PilT
VPFVDISLTVIVLSVSDVAEKRHLKINPDVLSAALGLPGWVRAKPQANCWWPAVSPVFVLRFQNNRLSPKDCAMLRLQDLLTSCLCQQASDLHLSTGLPPLMRLHGQMERMSAEVLESEAIRQMLQGVMNTAMWQQYADNLDIDFAFDIPQLGRFRVNAFHQTRGLAAAIRLIPSQIPALSDIQAPAIVPSLLKQARGLILVTGPTGSGKSTTLAAMVDHINTFKGGHILTVEDPVEFVHTPKRSLLHQREVGPHALSFANALRAALREDPDVILVGELRDLETTRLAMTAAETGHLVLATVHTSSAAKTVDRLVDVFPGDEKNMARALLSESLLAVISQTLCLRQDGLGRVAAHEVMVATPAIRNLIREAKVAQMYSVIQTGHSQGMHTLDQHLQTLIQQGHLNVAEAQAHAQNPELLRAWS